MFMERLSMDHSLINYGNGNGYARNFNHFYKTNGDSGGIQLRPNVKYYFTNQFSENDTQIFREQKKHYLLETVLLQQPGIAYIKFADDKTYLCANDHFKEMFGVNDSVEVKNKNNYSLRAFMKSKLNDKVTVEIQQLEEKAFSENIELNDQITSPMISTEGKVIVLSLNIAPLSIKDSGRKLLMCYATDYTDKLAHTELLKIYQDFFQDQKVAIKKFVDHIGLGYFLYDKSDNITPRELDCLILLSKGLTAKQSASILDISHRTIEAHLKNIKEKFDANNNSELLGMFLSCYRN